MEESYKENDKRLFLNIDNSITEIHNNEYCFANLSKGVIIDPINSSLKKIGEYAFSSSHILEFTVPQKVTTLGDYCFKLCTNLSKISLQGTKLTTVPTGFCDSCYTLSNVNLSYKIITINDYAFSGCSSLREIIIPDNITSINNYSFYNCSELKEFTLSNNSKLNKIGEGTFQYCSSLEKFIFPKNMQMVGNNIFEFCNNLKDVYFFGNNIYPKTLFNNCYSDIINIYYNSNYKYKNYFIPSDETKFNYIKLNSNIISSLNLMSSSKLMSSSNFMSLKPYNKYNSSNSSNPSSNFMLSEDNNSSDLMTTTNPIPISNICFLENIKINTDQGIIEIKNINPEINTIYNKKIIGISKTITNEKYLISFEKSCLYNNIPKERTVLSQNHKIFYKGKWLHARLLLNKKGVNKIVYNGEILYNILMEKYDTVNVNNLICETLHPNNIIAKIIKNNYTEEYKNKIIILMNKYIMNKEYKKIKKLSELIN